MSTADLKAVTTGAGDEKPKDFPAMLTAWLPEIARALPKHLNADRMSRIALTAFRRTPKLAECDPRSVFAAVIQASQLGLEPDTLGRSYLIPYKVKKVGKVGVALRVPVRAGLERTHGSDEPLRAGLRVDRRRVRRR
jgi:phage RecT family recombinase